MPLTGLQQQILALLASDESAGRYLAGGAALHIAPDSQRYSEDLDFFHDAEARVGEAFATDRARLEDAGYRVEVEFAIPGMVRAVVSRDDDSTRIDWAHDSAWRFMPLVRDPDGGLLLHPVDLAVNKILALAGRDEARDYVDALYAHRTIAPLAALVWAACGKDPGFTPHSLLELLKRRGRPRPEDITRLALATPFDLGVAKTEWLDALAQAEQFVTGRPASELGCLYYSKPADRFVAPEADRPLAAQEIEVRFGSPGGVIARAADSHL